MLKAVLNIFAVATVCTSMTVSTCAALADARWTFPAYTTASPSVPPAANPTLYTTDDDASWTAADSFLPVSFVSGLRKLAAVGFSYGANQSGYLNSSMLELNAASSALPTGYSLITNASWTFPTNTTSVPSQPLIANLSSYSINNNLTWLAANSKLSASFVANPGETTALEFSYKGNHPKYLNGSILELTSTISGLPTGYSLTNIQLSYDIKWSTTANSVTNIWAYSINGGASVNFFTNAASGNVWQSAGSSLARVTLNNSSTITFSDTISGAAGNNGNLEFDNLQMTSDTIPEPTPLGLLILGISNTWLILVFRMRLTQRSTRPPVARRRTQR